MTNNNQRQWSIWYLVVVFDVQFSILLKTVRRRPVINVEVKDD